MTLLCSLLLLADLSRADQAMFCARVHQVCDAPLAADAAREKLPDAIQRMVACEATAGQNAGTCGDEVRTLQKQAEPRPMPGLVEQCQIHRNRCAAWGL